MLAAAALIAPTAGAARFDQAQPDTSRLDAAPERPVAAKAPKLSTPLATVARVSIVEGTSAALDVARGAGVEVSRARVEAVVESAPGSSAAVVAAVTSAAGEVVGEHAGLVQAWLPPAALSALAGRPDVRFVREPLRPQIHAVPGEGVGASGAAAWHAGGRSGTGVRVAVVDVGFGGLAARQAAGELPATVTTVNYCSGTDFTSEPHGTAVAEIVHEMAPGAGLVLICVNSDVTLGQAKEYVKAQGIPIVNTSLGWVHSSRGDGAGGPTTPEGIVTDARNAGVFWTSAAGNEAHAHWSGTFVDSDADRYHDFTPTDEGNTVTVAGGDVLCAKLKWDSWPTTNQDYDLYVTNSATGAVLAQSRDWQTGTQPPRETACFDNTGATPVTVGIFVYRDDGTQSVRLDLWAENHVLEHRNAAGSINEPASAPAAVAAGAICWQTSAYEPYSSQGPTIDGRVKPDIAGFAAVSSATYGLFTACAASGFLGTSAATPHVAGAAALVKQENPSFGPSELQTFLESRAVDLGVPGKDTLFGAGALALGTIATPPPPPPPPSPPPPPPPPVQPPPAPQCVVPVLRGKTLPQARTALTTRRCALGRVTRAFHTSVRRGRIVKQRPLAGSRLTAGARVNVVVSRGRRP